ncbi:MAG: type II toxin-antitoxin system VapB family antitoxin [Oribacterium sp.]|nr:type II toxin-antitoxin system VapB family antitoxin [Oribacterium sp.]MDY6308037.1 type II toxin-antitoxin system VapB family antitoxin [Oribacterium sp.]MDY6316321.1 type II toxin-antitoxin system VapB family antitoxin [Oribacterium sp.]
MATNLALDDSLLDEAVKVGGLKTKKATVTKALQEFIQRRQVNKLIDAFGTFDFDPDYDYKTGRKRNG